jgi:hypothetical protein
MSFKWKSQLCNQQLHLRVTGPTPPLVTGTITEGYYLEGLDFLPFFSRCKCNLHWKPRLHFIFIFFFGVQMKLGLLTKDEIFLFFILEAQMELEL